MDHVKLLTAYHWVCPGCYNQNFAVPVRADIDEATRESLFRQFNDLEDWQALPDDWMNSSFVSIPRTVTCNHCESEFLSFDERSEN